MASVASLLPPGTDLSQVPSLRPPPGVTPNFVDPRNGAPGVRAACGTMTAFMVVAVASRMYGKAFVLKSFAWEDAACIIATISSLAYFAVVMHALDQGLGPHMWDVPIIIFLDPGFVRELQVVNYMYGPIMIFVKLSILLLYFRLFAPFRFTRIWIYIGIALGVVEHLAGTIAYATTCIKEYPMCGNKLITTALVVSAINIISDFYILLLPLLVISRLQMRKSRKISVASVFATGFSACVVSIINLWYRVHTWESRDLSWIFGPLTILLISEIDIGIIVGCLPLLPVVVTHERGVNFLKTWWKSIASFYHQSLYRASKSSPSPSSGGYSHGDSRKGQSAWPGDDKGRPLRGVGTSRHYLELENFAEERPLKDGPMMA